MAVYARKQCCAKSEVIEAVLRQREGQNNHNKFVSQMLSCVVGHLRHKSEDTTVVQFRYMRDSKYGARSHIKKMSNTMFAHKVVGVYRNLPKKKDDCLMGQRQYLCVKIIAWYKKGKYLNEADIPKEESDFFMEAVEAAREYVKSLTGITFILWDVLDFTRRTYGQPSR